MIMLALKSFILICWA